MNYDALCAYQPVSRETYDRLFIYADLLRHWQTRINLISPNTLPVLWQRHIIDSLQLIPLLKPSDDGHPLLDMGSGAGLPGIVLACTGHHIHLVESDQRKAIFLEEVTRQLSLPATIYNHRLEQHQGSYSQIVARACASLTQLLHYAAPCLLPETICYFPKGRNCSIEMKEAEMLWQFDCQPHPSQTEEQGVILMLRHIQKR